MGNSSTPAKATQTQDAETGITIARQRYQPIRWNIFLGIILSSVGMVFLNYYALFPDADKKDEKLAGVDRAIESAGGEFDDVVTPADTDALLFDGGR